MKNKEDNKDYVKVPIEENLVDRLLRNIQKRTSSNATTKSKLKVNVATLDPKPASTKISSVDISARGDFSSNPI